MKDYIFSNIMFIIIYSSLFLFKLDIFMILLFLYLLIINFYYFLKIEKLKLHLQERNDIIESFIDMKGE